MIKDTIKVQVTDALKVPLISTISCEIFLIFFLSIAKKKKRERAGCPQELSFRSRILMRPFPAVTYPTVFIVNTTEDIQIYC